MLSQIVLKIDFSIIRLLGALSRIESRVIRDRAPIGGGEEASYSMVKLPSGVKETSAST